MCESGRRGPDSRRIRVDATETPVRMHAQKPSPDARTVPTVAYVRVFRRTPSISGCPVWTGHPDRDPRRSPPVPPNSLATSGEQPVGASPCAGCGKDTGPPGPTGTDHVQRLNEISIDRTPDGVSTPNRTPEERRTPARAAGPSPRAGDAPRGDARPIPPSPAPTHRHVR